MTKRIFDVVSSIIGLVTLTPLFLILSLIIKLDSNGPVFFRQYRVGKNGRQFKILKFRTMVINSESLGLRITKDADNRITKIGKLLRKYKLDELPQMINIFKGDMSFVGPRPELPEYVKEYNCKQLRVLDVRPGLTDYASIKFRNEGDILGKADNIEDIYIRILLPEKIRLNLEYIENRSLFIDLNLILSTLHHVFRS